MQLLLQQHKNERRPLGYTFQVVFEALYDLVKSSQTSGKGRPIYL